MARDPFGKPVATFPRSRAPNAKSPDEPGVAYIEGAPIFVTTGLDPVVHTDMQGRMRLSKFAVRMDCRVKPGNDEGCM
jgi:hypothetical protein